MTGAEYFVDRRGRLPEDAHYEDTGCDLAPACLSCPFEQCRQEDDAPSAAKIRSDARAADFRILRRRGISVNFIAEWYGVSRRTVFGLVAGDPLRTRAASVPRVGQRRKALVGVAAVEEAITRAIDAKLLPPPPSELRLAVREWVRSADRAEGEQTRMAKRFGVSRQRVSQLVAKEIAAMVDEVPDWLRRAMTHDVK